MIRPPFNKKAIIAGAGLLLVVVCLLTIAWPMAVKTQANARLIEAVDSELQPLVLVVSELIQGAAPVSHRECSERSLSLRSYTTRSLWCKESLVYKHSFEPLPESMRQDVIEDAKALDSLLVANGWKPTRPDKTQTVADTIPSSPLRAFYSEHISFSKEVGDVRCYLKVSFGGPTDGTSPGTVNITDFSCTQETRFFSPHIPRFTKQGFTPV